MTTQLGVGRLRAANHQRRWQKLARSTLCRKELPQRSDEGRGRKLAMPRFWFQRQRQALRNSVFSQFYKRCCAVHVHQTMLEKFAIGATVKDLNSATHQVSLNLSCVGRMFFLPLNGSQRANVAGSQRATDASGHGGFLPEHHARCLSPVCERKPRGSTSRATARNHARERPALRREESLRRVPCAPVICAEQNACVRSDAL